jgi:hypothetical protein
MNRDKILIAGPTMSGPATVELVPNSYRLGVGPPGGAPDLLALAAEVALQRTHLEVPPKIGLDSLRRGDGP